MCTDPRSLSDRSATPSVGYVGRARGSLVGAWVFLRDRRSYSLARNYSFLPYRNRMSESTQKQRVPRGDRGRVFRQGGSGPRVGLYARVSTHDQQTLPLQLSAMREHAERRGWTVAIIVEDVGSGVRDRPKREDLMRAARRRGIDLILVRRWDRWGRSL